MPQNVTADRKWPTLWGLVILFAHLMLPWTLLLYMIRRLGGAYQGTYEPDVPAQVYNWHGACWTRKVQRYGFELDDPSSGTLISIVIFLAWVISIVVALVKLTH